ILYLPHINIDNSLLNKPHFCMNLKNLSFNNESVKQVNFRYFFEYFKNSQYKKVLKEIYRVLIPGGNFNLEVKVKKPKKLDLLKKALLNQGFFIQKIDKKLLNINGTINLKIYKEIHKTSLISEIQYDKIRRIFQIIKNHKSDFENLKKVCIIAREKEIFSLLVKKELFFNENLTLVQSLEELDKQKSIQFDGCIILDFLEYEYYKNYESFFKSLLEKIKVQSPILLIVPYRENFNNNNVLQIFDKAILAKLLDDNNLCFQLINLDTSLKLIKTIIKKKMYSVLEKKDQKVLLLGNYSLRYSNFNMVCWDAQVRGFQELGYQIQTLDFKDYSFAQIIKFIKIYKPDILWTAGKVAIPLLIENSEFFKKRNMKIVYWFWDVREPINYDFSDIIDVMFISSRGEIPKYKKCYNLNRIYYMPTPISPQLLCINHNIEKVYEIGFTGMMDKGPSHKTRTSHIKYLKSKFNLKIVNFIYNNVPEFYSKCKIVFGGSPDFSELELYASFRMYYVLCCGSCYLTKYFPGLERLAENEKHLLWYNDIKEVPKLIDKYIKNDALRKRIENNARNLAIEKYHYKVRIENMMNIVTNKDDEFNGYIK
ncbi:MAG: glycosyltransferase, partial [Candidatus Lokiarchaeota archaeon]|nr:glycosyltransferase [Candidatus Lokiarchaeota archaeon]